MTHVEFWIAGRLEAAVSNLDWPENEDTCFEKPINWDCNFLPSAGDEINWFDFINIGDFSDDLKNKLKDLSFNSYVVRKCWIKIKENTICALTIDLVDK
jgi:hypothetical protein